MSGNTPHDNWSKVFHYILSKNLGDKFLELSKEDLEFISKETKCSIYSIKSYLNGNFSDKSLFNISNVNSYFFIAPVSLSILIGVYIAKLVIYLIHSS